MTRRRIAMLCLAAVTLLAQSAHAVNVDFGSDRPPEPPEETIDLATFRATLIVRGTIVSFEELDLYSAVENAGGFFSHATGTGPVAQVTLRVSEVLKGPHVETCVFRAKLEQLQLATRNWLANGGKTESLFFLVSEKYPWRTAAAEPGAPLVIYPGHDLLGLWALPLAPPSNPDRARPIDLLGVRHATADSILKATRDAVRAKVVSTEALTIRLTNSALDVVTPIDARLQAPARRWLGDRSQVDAALTVLAHFPSDESAAALMPLLKDGTSSGGSHKWDTRTYPLRLRAYDILKDFGRDVPRPVTEQVTAYVPVYRSAAAGSVAIVIVLLVAAPLLRRRFLAAGAVLSAATFIVVLGALLVRHQAVHEIAMSVGKSAYELGSYSDGLHLRRTEDCPVRVPLSYGKCDAGVQWSPQDLNIAPREYLFAIASRTGVSVCDPSSIGYHYYPFQQLTVPHWIAMVVCALLPAAWLTRLLAYGPRRRRARIAKGLCGECGYDVRVNTDGRCPECGAAVAPIAGGRGQPA